MSASNECTCASCGASLGPGCACDCCAAPVVRTPESITNRPGLPALTRRAGVHGTFFETMLARLSSADFPALRALTTRDLQDPSIALLDAWATAADVLTFYNERIANEGYLRTAAERRSLVELANLIGHRPRPGVAASTFLAFTLEDGAAVDIPPGLRVQSVPGPNEQPQTFETSLMLPARGELSALKPRMSLPQEITPDNAVNLDTVWFADTGLNLKPNDVLLFNFPGDTPVRVLRRIDRVTEDFENQRTEARLRMEALTASAFLQGLQKEVRAVFQAAKDAQAVLGALPAPPPSAQHPPALPMVTGLAKGAEELLTRKLTRDASLLDMESALHQGDTVHLPGMGKAFFVLGDEMSERGNEFRTAQEEIAQRIALQATFTGNLDKLLQGFRKQDDALDPILTMLVAMPPSGGDLANLKQSANAIRSLIGASRTELGFTDDLSQKIADLDTALEAALNASTTAADFHTKTKPNRDAVRHFGGRNNAGKSLRKDFHAHLDGVRAELAKPDEEPEDEKPRLADVVHKLLDDKAAPLPSPPTNLSEFIATLSSSELELRGLWTDLKDKLNQEFTTFTSGLKDFSPTNPSAALAELAAEIKTITDEIADLEADLTGLPKNSRKMERLWEAVQSLTGIVQKNLPVAASLSALGEACASARGQQKSFFNDMPDQFRKSAAKLISRYSFLQNSGSSPLLQAAQAINDWGGSLAGAASLHDLIEGYPAPPPGSTQKPGLNTVRKLVASLLTPQAPQIPPSPQDAATLRRLAGDLRGLHAQVASSPSGQQNPAEQSAGLTGGGLDSLFRSLLPSVRRPGDPLRLGRDLAKLASASDGNTSDLIALMASRLHGAGGEDLFDAWRKIHTGAPIAEVYVFRQQGAVFGHNAPIGFNGTGVAAGFNNRFNSSRGDTDWDPLPDERGRILFVEGEHAEVVPGSFVAIETLPVQLDVSLTFQRRPSSVLASVFNLVGATSPGLVSVSPDLDLTPYLVEDVSIGPRTAYSLSGKATRLTLPAGVSWLGGVPTGNPERFSKIRRAVIHMHSERLALAERPIERALGMGGPTADGDDGRFSDNPFGEDASLLMLSGLHRGLAPGRWIIVQGRRAGGLTETVSEELALIAGVEHVLLPSVADSTVPKPGDAPHTLITLSKPLSSLYKRSSVTIFGNVVEATHGETRKEVLGSGDARRAGQTFVLRQPPLTYVPADTESGVRSSLRLRVNGVLWHEQPDFLLSGPADRDYVVTADDGGVTRVMTGDGLHGSRLPTGLENITAVYRSGIGKAGNVKAGALTTLLDKPLGLKEAVNPLRAGGGADRDDLAAIRRNAPASVMALDRLVSVRDYADFAVTFAGIGKAASAALTDGTETLVHVTVAAIEDAPLDPEGLLVQSLSKSLLEFGDPLLAAAVAVRELVLVVLVAKIKVQADYLWENVEPAVRAALLREFGFERRELGQDIPLSEVLAVIQGIAGVSYADVDAFGGVPEKKTVVGTGAGTSFERRALTPQEIADAIQRIVSDPPPTGQGIPAQRVVVEMARRDTADPSQVLPAQIAFLTPDAPDTLILQEIPA